MHKDPVPAGGGHKRSPAPVKPKYRNNVRKVMNACSFNAKMTSVQFRNVLPHIRPEVLDTVDLVRGAYSMLEIMM